MEYVQPLNKSSWQNRRFIKHVSTFHTVSLQTTRISNGDIHGRL